ncbi:MAG TPA: acyl-CoA dehydrogenase family protein [Candidatus Binataceae bacterium]|nr:acyl-CoA dehydrogenase family protein [Candidatus Binataceae bacterium]
MDTNRAERQRRFIEMAAAHAADFNTRVAQHDRDNSFPFENVERMKASGYTAIMVPAELGGGGGDILDLVLAQERLARGDLPTAITINMHHFGVGWLADLWRFNDCKDGTVRSLLKAVADDRIIIGGGVSDPRMHSAVGFGGLSDTTRRAEKVEGGYLINGVGKFSTLCACADFLFETAHYEDPERGPSILGFYLPKNTPGIKVQNNWDSLSIRASSSHDILWDNVFVPVERARPRPVRTWDTTLKIFSSWVPSMNACYLGVAQAAHDWAINWARERIQAPFDRPMSHYPGNQFIAAQMEIGLRAARAMLLQTAGSLIDLAVRTEPPMMDIIACHQFVMETAIHVVDEAMRLVGGAALSRSAPLEQMFRDVRAAIIHQPFAGHDGLGWLGKLAFGIPHDAMPRWV